MGGRKFSLCPSAAPLVLARKSVAWGFFKSWIRKKDSSSFRAFLFLTLWGCSQRCVTPFLLALIELVGLSQSPVGGHVDFFPFLLLPPHHPSRDLLLQAIWLIPSSNKDERVRTQCRMGENRPFPLHRPQCHLLRLMSPHSQHFIAFI